MAPYRSRIAQALVLARRRAGLVIVSAHVGPNWGSPSRAMQMLAHELLDMGADLYWGHSNHTPPKGSSSITERRFFIRPAISSTTTWSIKMNGTTSPFYS